MITLAVSKSWTDQVRFNNINTINSISLQFNTRNWKFVVQKAKDYASDGSEAWKHHWHIRIFANFEKFGKKLGSTKITTSEVVRLHSANEAIAKVSAIAATTISSVETPKNTKLSSSVAAQTYTHTVSHDAFRTFRTIVDFFTLGLQCWIANFGHEFVCWFQCSWISLLYLTFGIQSFQFDCWI